MYIGLQVARGVAALLVLLNHASIGSVTFYGGRAFGGFWEFGSIGVDFFFVLSGFIIYWVHSNDKENLASACIYFKKRIIRNALKQPLSRCAISTLDRSSKKQYII